MVGYRFRSVYKVQQNDVDPLDPDPQNCLKGEKHLHGKTSSWKNISMEKISMEKSKYG